MGPWDVVSVRGAPSVRCTGCGHTMRLSFIVSLLTSVSGLLIGGWAGISYLRTMEGWLGEPIGLVPFLGTFVVAILAMSFACAILSSVCYLLYSAARSSS